MRPSKFPGTKNGTRIKKKERRDSNETGQNVTNFLTQNIENLLSANTRASEADILHLE